MAERKAVGTKKIVPLLGGYHYEFQVGALRLLDLIEGNATKVEFEAASDPNDFFDDIKVFDNECIHHYQVKWGLTRKSIRLSDFVNPSGNLYLLNLYQTWKAYSDGLQSHKHIFHVYSSKNIASDDGLQEYLEPADDTDKQFSDNKDGSYKLNTKIIESIKLDDQTVLPDDISAFFESLVVEVSQPDMPINEDEEKQFGNPVRDLLLEKISYRLGLDKFPSFLRPEDVLALLIKESYESAIGQRPVTRENIVSKIGIKNLISISQEFPFDKKRYVETPEYLEKLVSKFEIASGKLMGVIGLPGTGKSHLLTFWSNRISDSGTKPIMYYCFIGNESHPDIRITQNQLLQDLINSILRKYPDIGLKEEHSLLAATPERLNTLLSNLGEYARAKQQTIPVIIDGLDHVGRTKEKYSDVLYSQSDVLDFLKDLEIPDGIALIVGSQPGSHLDRLKEKFGEDNFIEIKGFTEDESKKYLTKFGINESKISNNTINSVIKKSGGLPLLLAYSVQANRELSSDDRLTYFVNISEELPETGGNVKTYYDWLWKDISSKPITCHYARLLSLVDFPTSNDLLENVISKSVRLGADLDECLNPLISVTKTTKEGLSFFHDSFGTYVRSEDSFSAEDHRWYFENLYRYFHKIGLHNSDLAYAKGIGFAFKAQLYDEILNVVSLDFVDDSILMAFPQHQIISQIDFAIKSSVHTKNIPLLVRNCVMRKYTKDRFEFNYPLNEIAYMFIKFKKDKQLLRLIFSNNSLTTDLATTIDLLSLCLESNMDLPYKKILSAWRSKIRENSDDVQEELKHISRKNYAKVVTRVYGLDYTLNWIDRNRDFGFDEDVFKTIGKSVSVKNVEKLFQKPNLEYGDIIIVLNSFLHAKDKKRANELLSDCLSKKEFLTPYMINLGIELGINQTLIEKACRKFVPKQPSVHPWDEDIDELYQLENSAKCLSYCGKTGELKTIIEVIREYPLTSARLIQEMMFLVAVFEGKIASKRDIVEESDNLLSELERFINHNTENGVSPRDFDCTRLQYVIKYILKKLVKLYLTICDKPNLEKLVGLITKLNHKFEWYAVGCFFILVSTEHMISCFSEVMKKFPDNNYVKQKIIETIRSDDIPASTGHRVDYFLNASKIYLRYGMMRHAETAFNNAMLATHAYGYRKDMFLDEIHEIAINLNKINPSASLERAEEILRLTKYLWGVTDHAETKFIPAYVSKELLRLRTTAGIKLLRQFINDGYTLASVECIPFAVSSMKNASSFLRWELVTYTPYERNGATYNDENWLLDMKFELVKQAIDENNNKLAKEIMENIRNQLTNELKVLERRWEKDFQSYAEILKIPLLAVSGKSSTDSYLVDSKREPPNIIKDGTVKEVITQFENLDNKQQFDAGKDVEAIFESKIEKMNEDERDMLTSFLSKEPRGIFNSTCGDLLEKIALKYEGVNNAKFLKIMFLAFETYGWIGYGYPSIVKWLAKTYSINTQKTMDFVLESFARFSVEKYGPHGSILRLAEFLYLTNQIDVLDNLYRELHDFCKSFFRTYGEEFDEFLWLRGSKFETVNDEQIIKELIELA